MTIAVVIALVALILVGLFAVVGLCVLGVALYLWLYIGEPIQEARPSPVEQPAHSAFDDTSGDDPATEVFNRSHLFAVFDSDEMDATEVVRMEAGILLDGRTDPALVRSHGPSSKADKD